METVMIFQDALSGFVVEISNTLHVFINKVQ